MNRFAAVCCSTHETVEEIHTEMSMHKLHGLDLDICASTLCHLFNGISTSIFFFSWIFSFYWWQRASPRYPDMLISLVMQSLRSGYAIAHCSLSKWNSFLFCWFFMQDFLHFLSLYRHGDRNYRRIICMGMGKLESERTVQSLLSLIHTYTHTRSTHGVDRLLNCQ